MPRSGARLHASILARERGRQERAGDKATRVDLWPALAGLCIFTTVMAVVFLLLLQRRLECKYNQRRTANSCCYQRSGWLRPRFFSDLLLTCSLTPHSTSTQDLANLKSYMNSTRNKAALTCRTSWQHVLVNLPGDNCRHNPFPQGRDTAKECRRIL